MVASLKNMILKRYSDGNNSARSLDREPERTEKFLLVPLEQVPLCIGKGDRLLSADRLNHVGTEPDELLL
jgi:hypothetical protein